MGIRRWMALLGVPVLTVSVLLAGAAHAPRAYALGPAPVGLGVAASYSVLGGTGGVTNSGATTISGDVGSSPPNTIVGFPPGTIGGTKHEGDAAALGAQTALNTAILDATLRVPTNILAPLSAALSGTFTAGVYRRTGALTVATTVTLNGGGDPTSVFIFQVSGALSTAAGSNVILTNGAVASNVFWQSTGAVDTGANSIFNGTILATGAITIGADASLTGRAPYAGAVTLSTNTVKFTVAGPPSMTITGGPSAATNDTTPTIAGTTGAPVGATVTVTIAGQTLTAIVQSGGGWSVTAAVVAQGDQNVVASAGNGAGDIGKATQVLTVDTVAPVVTITGGATGSTNTVTPTITGTATGVVVGTAVIVTVAGQTLNTTVQAGGSWTVTAATMTQGVKTVVASVTDPAGNTGTATQALTVDTTTPMVPLGTTSTYSVLAGTGVVNTGATNLSGDLGSSPGNSILGFPPGTVGGTTHAGDSAAAQAQVDLTAAYNNAAGRVLNASFAGDQNGHTFFGGVYRTSAAFSLTGTMTLDAQGDPGAVFIFQVGAALNTAAASHIVLINGALASRVFWQVLGAVGTGASSTFAGTIMSLGAITSGASAELAGRALSVGTVTLSTNPVYFSNLRPPSVAITGGGSAFTFDTTPTIAGTTDAATGSAVAVTVAGQTLNTTVQSGGNWSVTAAVVTPATFPVVASVTNAAGDTGTARQNLTVGAATALVALGSAGTYSVLAGTGVVNTGATSLSGDLGVSPSSSVVGFPPGTVGGVIHAGDAQAAQAQADLVLAYNDAAGRTPNGEFAGDQNGQTFTAGVYHTTAAFGLTGNLTLDAQGDPNAVFIFQVGAALNTAAASHIVLINGAQAARVFWQALGAVGTGASSSFTGTILAAGAITLGASATLNGRALSYGTVTLSSNVVTTPAVAGGVLSITVPASASLGSRATSADSATISGLFGQVQVVDGRGAAAGSGWIASVTSTAFTTPGGATIPASAVSYVAGTITRVGIATYTANNPGSLDGQSAAVTATGITGDNSATWNPTIFVALPSGMVAGVYSATITHSVL
ncbi:MAG: ice-binding family protein [Pseudonocardiales bacterium]